ncbi:hypothetical protein IMCC9480_1988 [Oxalobacteraceae bacterium IMCC9480]|nr:hypothetical protein IMCC9480_1988 [Oxalobacteraceae bacterium IMCC9480]NDP58050.1 hypothetical protein [Oxalobacteraceae bacterium]
MSNNIGNSAVNRLVNQGDSSSNSNGDSAGRSNSANAGTEGLSWVVGIDERPGSSRPSAPALTSSRQTTQRSAGSLARQAERRQLRNLTATLDQTSIASSSNSTGVNPEDGASTSAAARLPLHERDGEHFRRQPLTLMQLKFGDERPDQLIDLPGVSHQRIALVRAPVDSATGGLTGRAYLEHLMRDDLRLPPALQMLIEGKHILRTGPHDGAQLSDAALSTIAERLRPVMAEMYRDPELVREIGRLATDTLGNCTDRFDDFAGQMENAALLSNLNRGAIDEKALWRYGISFFKLDVVRSEVGRLYRSLNIPVGSQSQDVHDHHNAVYYLQDELNLPTRHDQPIYIGARLVGIMTEARARAIGEKVKARAAENDGEHAFNFMATWEPWKTHLQNRDEQDQSPEFQQFTQVMNHFEKLLERTARNRDVVGSITNRLNPVEYDAELGTIMAGRNQSVTDACVHLSRKFLLNYRANYLHERDLLPDYFK